jgi:hypothetical protein
MLIRTIIFPLSAESQQNNDDDAAWLAIDEVRPGTHAWAHAIRHGSLAEGLAAMECALMPMNHMAKNILEPLWLFVETINKIIQSPEQADECFRPMVLLLRILRHARQWDAIKSSMYGMLVHQQICPALKTILDFHEDEDTDFGMIEDMHMAFAKVFPCSGYFLMLADEDIGDDAVELIDFWPAPVQDSIFLCRSLGLSVHKAVHMAWTKYRVAVTVAELLPLNLGTDPH